MDDSIKPPAPALPISAKRDRGGEVPFSVRVGDRTEACLRAFIDACPDSVILIDGRGGIVQVNQTAEKTFGYTRSELLGRPLTGLMAASALRDNLVRALRASAPPLEELLPRHPVETSALRRDGSEFPTELVLARFLIDGEVFLNAYFRDLRERRQVEMELRKLAAVTRLNPNALFEFTEDGSVTYFNDAALGLALAFGETHPGRILPPDAVKIVQHCLSEGQPCLAHESKAGERTLSWSFYPNTASAVVHCYGRDVTEQRQLEAQFLRAQRLESIGTLASGIAHDLNNILAPIMMSVNLLEETLQDNPHVRLLDTLRMSTQRGAEMVRQILSFTRGQEGGRTRLDLRHLIAETCRIAGSTFPRTIEVEANASKDLWPIIADATQMHQVLMNLCVNARDAMPDGGRLRIQTENVPLDESSSVLPSEASPGPYVRLTVTDTGTGIPPSAIDKIWQPFFTMKPKGKGSGLGLSTVRDIVRAHSGFIDLTTEAGKGTSFRILLPAADHALRAPQLERSPTLPAGRGETILVVDDERAFQEITKAIFNRHGYHVLTASDGTEAVAEFTHANREISLVITDMVMPYLDGPATIRALRRLDPGLRIIATSGLSERGNAAAQLPEVTFLLKPFTTETLLTAVHRVLRPGDRAP